MILIIPCYNEAQRANPSAWRSIPEDIRKILFVNDGSSDRTDVALANIQAGYDKRFQILSLRNNVGKGEAIRAGINHVIDNPEFCEGNLNDLDVGYCDFDLSTPLEEMVALYRAYKGANCDVMFGARVKMKGFNIQRNPLRHWLGRIAATLISELLAIDVYDTQAGAKVFNQSAAKKLFDSEFQSRWLFDCELVKRAQSLDLNYREHPLRQWIHEETDSKISFSSYWKSLIDLLRIFKRYVLKK